MSSSVLFVSPHFVRFTPDKEGATAVQTLSNFGLFPVTTYPYPCTPPTRDAFCSGTSSTARSDLGRQSASLWSMSSMKLRPSVKCAIESEWKRLNLATIWSQSLVWYRLAGSKWSPSMYQARPGQARLHGSKFRRVLRAVRCYGGQEMRSSRPCSCLASNFAAIHLS